MSELTNPTKQNETCRLVDGVIYCQCGKPSSHYGTMGVQGAREVREQSKPPSTDQASDHSRVAPLPVEASISSNLQTPCQIRADLDRDECRSCQGRGITHTVHNVIGGEVVEHNVYCTQCSGTGWGPTALRAKVAASAPEAQPASKKRAPSNLPQLLRDAERRVNEHVWGDRRSLVTIPADVSRDVDILLLVAADEVESLRNDLQELTCGDERYTRLGQEKERLRAALEDAADMLHECALECSDCDYGDGATGKGSEGGVCEECAPTREAERRARESLSGDSSAPETSEVPWILWFADIDKKLVHFAGHGAEVAARRAFQQATMAWTCRLYRCVDQSGYGPRPSAQETSAPATPWPGSNPNKTTPAGVPCACGRYTFERPGSTHATVGNTIHRRALPCFQKPSENGLADATISNNGDKDGL